MENDDVAINAAAHAETIRLQQSCPHFAIDGRGHCEGCGIHQDELNEMAYLAWRKFMDSDLED
jgi:hypothetical protein